MAHTRENPQTEWFQVGVDHAVELSDANLVVAPCHQQRLAKIGWAGTGQHIAKVRQVNEVPWLTGGRVQTELAQPERALCGKHEALQKNTTQHNTIDLSKQPRHLHPPTAQRTCRLTLP
jgi:hypothetical protein